jgi:ParB/RepB/Spo0J family partition protein
MSRKVISQTVEFDPDRVRPLPGQPRKRFYGIKELAASIQEVGQSTPGIVTPVKDDPKFDAQLIDGERRLRACQMLGCPFRAEVREGGVEDAFVASFAANFGKQEHDPIEIAEALERLSATKTHKQMAAIAGKSDCWVSQHLSLLKLHPDVQAMLVAEEGEKTATLSYSVAILLTNLDQDVQLKLAKTMARTQMSQAAARRLVLKQDPSLKRNADGTNRIRLERIESIVEDVTNRIGVFLDMPGSEINQVIDQAHPRDRRQTAEACRDVAGDFTALAQAIESRLPKLTRRAG